MKTNRKHQSLLLIVACFCVSTLAEEMKFSYNLPASQNVCFQQNIAENIQAVVEVGSDSTQLALTVSDPKGKQLDILDGQKKLRYQFTSFTGGSHQLCITNKEARDIEFEFMIQTGVEAKDYSNIITKKHLKPIEVQAQKVQDMVKQLRQELSYLVMNEENLKEQNQKIKSRVLIFGIISILVMGISTYLQITYLKNFFRYKKII
ncbi:erv25p [Stylonychia lemnae]|uniref:Erv25p n=1 Tax=Stylonychia lemnae TaxID=5949 RepID=A0A078AXC9_STYLE|nr:erv25p [Stylonychia lemnae]|eukprot:CDW87120.1 erv25p [Stylonychia lemnae]